MTQHLAVVQQVIVPGDVDHCWRSLSDPHLVSEWFADTDQIKLNEPVHFTFGDGDFFNGMILESEEPTFIRLVWKFMGVGTPSDVSLFLCPLDGKTEVTVVDRGEYTTQAAAELREGWRDFLTRLERRIRTGENSRYRWRLGDGDGPDVSIEALVQCDEPLIFRTLRDISWWREAFPHANPVLVTAGPGDETIQAVFQDVRWSGRQTEATVEMAARRDGLGISVRHTGWTKLPQDIQLDARRRFADLWYRALLKMEHRFGIDGNLQATSSDAPVLANAKP